MTSPLRVGLAQTNITPWLDIELSGYGFFLNRTGQSVHQELLAQAVAFDVEGQSALIISTDLIGYNYADVVRWRQAIAVATGVAQSHVIFTATHTHSGPASMFLLGCGEEDPTYKEFLSKRLVDVACRAHACLEPAQLSVAEQPLPGIAFNRTRSDGPVDDLLQALFIEDQSGSVRAVLTRFSCHPVVFRNHHTYISPDFVAAFRQSLIKQWPNVVPVYLQGACGDLNPNVSVYQGEPEVAVNGIGMAVAGGVLGLYGRRKPLEVPSLEALTTMIHLPHAPLKEEDLDAFAASIAPANLTPASLAESRARFAKEATGRMRERLDAGDLPASDRVELQQLRLGPLTMLFHGAELFSDPAIRLREALPGLWVVGYSNDFWGYVPDSVDFDRKGYAAVTVPYMVQKPPYTRDVADRFVEEALQFLAH